jgi:hypothetical protein
MVNKMHDEIAAVAHGLYEKSGRVHGRDMQNWLEAEKIVLARQEKSTKKAKPTGPSKTATKKRK